MNDYNTNSDLDNYLLFTVIVEAGSITKAAKQLSLPKSKLSRRLAQLEQQLGSQLLIRTTRSQQLTEHGLLLYQQCQPHIAALASMEQLIYESQNKIKGQLKLLLPLEFFNRVVGQLITNFALQHAELEIQCAHYTQGTPEFDHQYDLVFVLHEQSLPATNWIGRTLLSFPQSIYQSQSIENKVDINLANISSEAAVVATENELWLFRDSNTQLVKPKVSTVMSSSEMRITACQRGLGLVKLPDYIAKTEENISALILEKPLLAQQLTLLYQSRNIPKKTRVFLDYFQSKIGCLS